MIRVCGYAAIENISETAQSFKIYDCWRWGRIYHWMLHRNMVCKLVASLGQRRYNVLVQEKWSAWCPGLSCPLPCVGHIFGPFHSSWCTVTQRSLSSSVATCIPMIMARDMLISDRDLSLLLILQRHVAWVSSTIMLYHSYVISPCLWAVFRKLEHRAPLNLLLYDTPPIHCNIFLL